MALHLHNESMLAQLCLCIVALTAHAGAPAEPNYLVNGDFENSLKGWTVEGDARLEADHPITGKGAVRLGAKEGKVQQRYAVGGERIVYFGAFLKASAANVVGNVRVRCFDKANHLLMDLAQDIDPKKGQDPKGFSTGVYFKTHSLTNYLVASIEKPKSGGTIIADSASLQDYDKDRKEHAPTCDLDEYMAPIWSSKTTYNETVLLLSEKGGPASGELLYNPQTVLKVQNSALTKTFKEGVDFAIEGRKIVAMGSAISTMKDSDFPTTEYPWLDIGGKKVVVTYTHNDTWHGPTPTYSGDFLPRTMAKLKAKKPLKIAAFGDSITLGINVSSYRQEAPYMPTWANLFARQLGKVYGSRVTMFNAGLGGMTAQWGKDNARQAVGSLKPDLVTIAFGMNDFWSYGPSDFAENVRGMMAEIRKEAPACEFILISTIKFDPAYTADPTYVGHILGYRDELRKMVGNGVQLLDMTEMSDALYKAKKAKDLETDPMHPDDFLARWYAQGLVAMLDNRHPAATRTFHLDPAGDDGNDGISKPWKTLEHASKHPFQPGDHLVLKTGATFHGSLNFGDSAGTPTAPIVVDGSSAIIVSSKASAVVIGRGGFEIRNLILKGEATKALDGHDGISLLSRGVKERYIRVENVDASGFGGSGIAIGCDKGEPKGSKMCGSRRSIRTATSGAESSPTTASRGRAKATAAPTS